MKPNLGISYSQEDKEKAIKSKNDDGSQVSERSKRCSTLKNPGKKKKTPEIRRAIDTISSERDIVCGRDSDTVAENLDNELAEILESAAP